MDDQKFHKYSCDTEVGLMYRKDRGPLEAE